MILNKATAAICSSNHLPVALSTQSPQSLCGTIHASSTRQCSTGSLKRAQHRNYASVNHASPSDKKPSEESPPLWPVSENPTPYEVFNLQKGASYSKAQFYELVKLYHPDRHRHVTHTGLSHAVRLERYRLIVAANDILSDPVKRRAYDRFGAGWGSKFDMHNLHRQADRSWRKEPGNPSMNATWEDWERWYGERDSSGKYKKQEPVYMSNELFVGVIFLFILAGSFGQARRAGNSSMNLLEMREQKHEAASQTLRHRQVSLAGLNREERVETFLRQREGWTQADASANMGTHRQAAVVAETK